MPVEGKTRLRVASYNIRKCVGLDWRRDPDRTLRVIAALDADIVALQEADKRFGARPAALRPDRIVAETGLLPVPLARGGPSVGWHGNALLLAPRVEVEEVRTIALPGLEPRGAVWARLAVGRTALCFLALHLGLRRRCRARQMARVTRILRGRGAPAIAAGDFNAWSTGEVEAGLPELRLVVPGRSFHAGRPFAALDLIALSPGVEALRTGVVPDGEARRASDHLPVFADLDLPSAAAR